MSALKWAMVLFIALSISCHSQKKESPKEKFKDIDVKPTLNNLPNKKEVKDFLEITEQELQALIEGSKIGRVLVFRRDNVFEISSDKTLTYAILGSDNSVESLQDRFGNIFTIEHSEFENEMFEESQWVSKLSYKESFIKIYFNPEIGKTDIVSGEINNPEIILAKGIQVGESKDEFFAKIFKNASAYNFSAVDTFCNGDEMGEIHQYFIFISDTLRQILLRSEYDWIPFN